MWRLTEGNFLQAVYERFLNAHGETRDLSAELVILHNDGQIDLIAGFRALRNAPVGPDFFLTRDIIEEALPHLKAPVLSVMECVRHLANEAGQGGTASTPFIDFCAAEPSRPKACRHYRMPVPVHLMQGFYKPEKSNAGLNKAAEEVEKKESHSD